MSTQKIMYEWIRPFLIPFLGAISAYLILFTRLDTRVAAVEETLNEGTAIVERFIQLEQRDEILVRDVAEIKKDVKELLRAVK